MGLTGRGPVSGGTGSMAWIRSANRRSTTAGSGMSSRVRPESTESFAGGASRAHSSRSLMRSHSLPSPASRWRGPFIRTSVQRPRSLWPRSSNRSLPLSKPVSKGSSSTYVPRSQTMTYPAP